jgi:hypothetical protein
MNLDEADPSFIQDFYQSSLSVGLTAAWFSTRGHRAMIPEMEARPSYKVRQKYRDGGDLLVRIDGDWEIVEVVHRRDHDFTGARDFRYRSIIVCTDAEKSRGLPFIFVVYDRDMSHVALVQPDTEPTWTQEERKIGGRNQLVWLCPTDQCLWMPFPLAPGNVLS